MLRNTALAAGALIVAGLTAAPAQADLKVCNNTESTVNVAMGYKDNKGWATEGWWTIAPQKCTPLLKGDLIARYYYVFAIDRDKGGSWGGKSMMCTNTKVFTIRGIADCESQGYTKTGFFEVDTREEKDWTVSLSGDKTTQGQ
ncbi:DUF1036 domain-containing protein [Aestuariivirga sp.]|uniref:DUF1036 domain-containing protein n=1 Tax=Aestuariivirga sp. TaxID=2650926 RepID=UPI0025BB241D|nr:DUF1036 domain-containing protein [Aestuariivirga sp.]MCA3555007.1 DUF1036 domain-containing protein [Aestuariivirga sp.]